MYFITSLTILSLAAQRAYAASEKKQNKTHTNTDNATTTVHLTVYSHDECDPGGGLGIVGCLRNRSPFIPVTVCIILTKWS